MEINGYWLAGSIIAMILIFAEEMKTNIKTTFLGSLILFAFLSVLAILFMGLAFGSR